MMNVASQSSRGRSRSRSRSASVRRTTRAVSVRVPRSIRYNGLNKISRLANLGLVYVKSPSAGYSIGASQYSDFAISFSPTSMTINGSSVNFTSVNWPGASEFSNLYEEMKIDKIELQFHVLVDSSQVSTSTATVTTPLMCISTDYNDVASGSLTQTQQQEKAKFIQPSSTVVETYSVVPKYNQLVQYTSLASGLASRTGYVGTSLDIPHYGVRVSVLDPVGVASHVLYVTAKLFCTLRNVK